MPNPLTRESIQRAAAVAAVAVLLLLVLWLHVLAALVCALGSHVVYAALRRRLGQRVRPRAATAVAVVLTVALVGLLVLGVVAAADALTNARGGVPGLLELLADMVERLRSQLPDWISARLPQSTGDLQHAAGAWLRTHAQDLQRWGEGVVRTGAHLFVGLVIGLLSAFEAQPRATAGWSRAAVESAHNLVVAFRAIVSAQLRIALVNTALTAVFLLAILPLFGVRLPLSFALLALTFVAGLVPIVGNLAANAAIVLVALGSGFSIALAATAFLVAIHKLEYFLNAHFVGQGTRVPASWLLASMLLLEAGFGVPGLVAAPIYCAWFFTELRRAGGVE